MARIETWLKCDLQAMVRVQELDGDLFTADNQANRIGVIVTDKGVDSPIQGGIIGYVIRPDEATLVVNGTASGNRGWIDLPASAYVYKGPISIVIKNGNTTIGACHGYMNRSTTDTIVDPGRVIPSISELLAEIANMRSATEAANTATANANTAASNADAKATVAENAATNADAKATVAENAAQNANTKATQANSAAMNANTAASKIDNMTVAANDLPAGSPVTVSISEVNGHKHIVFGLVHGAKGDKGDRGKDFHISKTFVSIAAMMAYTGTDIEAYDFAMIDTGSVEDRDTGKLYCYEPDKNPKWNYIGDLSGAQGIKGETGTGVDHISLNADYTLTIYYTDGTSDTTASIRGATGITPDIAIGTVATLLPGQQAYVQLDSSSTPEHPVMNFGIPKGETGTADNVYGNTVPMSSTDSTKVATAINAKLDANQGNANAGKFMRVGSTGAVEYDYPTERYASLNDFPATGDEGKLYIAEGNGMIYVWDDEYVPVGGFSEEDCEVSGDIVSFDAFESPVKELKVAIEPVQDLHGQDHPWVGGAGKNLLPMTVAGIKDANSGTWSGNSIVINNVTFTIQTDSDGNVIGIKANGTANANTNLYLIGSFGNGLSSSIFTGCPTGGGSSSYRVFWDNNGTDTGSGVTVASPVSGDVRIQIISGYNAQNIIFYPMIRLSTETDSTYEPYENICPISGWTGCNVTRTGKNLYHGKHLYEKSYISSTGEVKPLNDMFVTEYIPVTGGENYTISFINEKSGFLQNVIGYNANHQFLQIVHGFSSSSPGTLLKTTVTMPANVAFITMNTLYGDTNFQVIKGEYVPFDDQVYSITFPTSAGTVYGGTLTINDDGTGELVVDRMLLQFTGDPFEEHLGMEESFLPNEYNFFIATYDGEERFKNSNVKVPICNEFANATISTETSDIGFSITNNQKINFRYELNNNLTMSDLYAWLAQHPLQVVAWLIDEDCITYQLTNQQVIQLLEGRNVLWSDTGNILSLKYYRTKIAYQVDKNTEDIIGKADKVSGATNGHLAGLDANGNLTDSGKSAEDFAGAIYKIATPGSIITFEDGADDLPVKEMKVAIEPVQDLNGYEHPWPAGAGKNKWNGGTATVAGITYTYNSETGEYTINGTATGISLHEVAVSLPAGTYTLSANNATVESKVSIRVNSTQGAIPGIALDAVNKTQTISTSGYDIEKVVIRVGQGETINNFKFKPQIEAGSSATSFAPYSNICPITGWTGANVTRMGKNLLSVPSISLNKDNQRTRSIGIHTILPGTYLFSWDYAGTSTKATIVFRTANNVSEDQIQIRADLTSPFTITFTKPYSNIYAFISNTQASGTTAEISNMMIRSVSDPDSTFEPYQGETYDITFPSQAGTVYGGMLTVEKDGSGILKIDKALANISNFQYAISTSVSSGGLHFVNSNGITPNVVGSSICSMLQRKDGTVGWSSTSECFAVSENSIRIYTSAQTTEDFRSKFNDVQIVYTLTNPVSYELTAPQVRTLLGLNRIWADAGDITELIYSVNTDTAMALYEKADKVANATVGNLAALDAEGNLTDSGIAAENVATKEDVNSTQDGIAIVAVGDTHDAISSGQFVFVRNHPTLAKGMYKATVAIAANGALSTSNLTADESGGLNDLQGQVDALSSNFGHEIGTGYIRFNSGLQVCWGQYTPTRQNTQVAMGWINFAKSFSSAPTVTGNPHQVTNGADELGMNVKIGTIGNAKFMLVEQSIAESFTSQSDVHPCEWIAIGMWK